MQKSPFPPFIAKCNASGIRGELSSGGYLIEIDTFYKTLSGADKAKFRVHAGRIKHQGDYTTAAEFIVLVTASVTAEAEENKRREEENKRREEKEQHQRAENTAWLNRQLAIIARGIAEAQNLPVPSPDAITEQDLFDLQYYHTFANWRNHREGYATMHEFCLNLGDTVSQGIDKDQFLRGAVLARRYKVVRSGREMLGISIVIPKGALAWYMHDAGYIATCLARQITAIVERESWQAKAAQDE
jgi:hypothetical protein